MCSGRRQRWLYNYISRYVWYVLGKVTGIYVTLCVCDITAKTVRKLKWWNRIAGVVAKRKTSQKRNLFLRVFNMHFWNPTAIKQGSQWKWSAKRHHHDINMWQTPSFQQDKNHNKHENWWKRWADFRAVRKFKLSTCWIFSLLHPTHLAYQVVDGPNVVQHLVEVVESGRNDRKNISDRNRKRYTQDHPQKIAVELMKLPNIGSWIEVKTSDPKALVLLFLNLLHPTQPCGVPECAKLVYNPIETRLYHNSIQYTSAQLQLGPCSTRKQSDMMGFKTRTSSSS